MNQSVALCTQPFALLCCWVQGARLGTVGKLCVLYMSTVHPMQLQSNHCCLTTLLCPTYYSPYPTCAPLCFHAPLPQACTVPWGSATGEQGRKAGTAV